MGIYFFILIYIILGRLFAKQHRKFYLISCFGLLILVAAFRDYSIGIDLSKHYARNFTYIASADWSKMYKFTQLGGYDIGFVVFCKLISYISTNVQWFIIVSSVITFGLIGRYIYKYSDDVALETFMFFSSMIYFMYLNIIAQALAIAIVTIGLDKLAKKKYLLFIIWLIIATTVHSSAIICLIFIPLSILPAKRKYIFGYVIVAMVALLGANQIIKYVFTNVFTNFSYYLTDSSYADGRGVTLSWFNLFQIAFTLGCILIPYISCYYRRNAIRQGINKTQGWRLKFRKKLLLVKEDINITGLNTNFLMYVTITSIICRILITKMAIIERMGYYFYFLGFSVLARAVANIENKKNREITLICIYVFMIAFFIIFGKSAGKQSYGVVPYKFF